MLGRGRGAAISRLGIAGRYVARSGSGSCAAEKAGIAGSGLRDSAARYVALLCIAHCREVCGEVGERFMRGGGRRNRRVWAQGLRHALSGVVVLHCSLFGVEGSKSPNEFWFVALLRAGRSQGRRFELGVGPVTPF